MSIWNSLLQQTLFNVALMALMALMALSGICLGYRGLRYALQGRPGARGLDQPSGDEPHPGVAIASARDAVGNALLDSAVDGVFIAQDYRFVFANQALASLLDHDLESFLGLPFSAVVAPEIDALWTARYEQRIGSGSEPPRIYEVQFIAKGGRRVDLELVASRSSFQGRPAVVGLVRDIAERQRARAEIEAHRDRLEELVSERTRDLEAAIAAQIRTQAFAETISDNQPTLLAYIDRGLHLQFVNRSILRWFGKEREEVMGRHLGEVLGQAGVLQWDDGYIERVLNGETVERHMKMLDTQGRVGEFLTYRLPDIRHGVTQGFYFIATDVTAVVRSDQKLREVNEALRRANESLAAAANFSRQIADATPGAMTYWDAELKCRFVNRAFLKWFGLDAENVIGKTRAELFGTRHADAVGERLNAALRGERQQFEFDCTLADGTSSTFLVHYAPARPSANEDPGVYMMAFDITALKTAERALTQTNLKLARSRDEADAANRAKSAFLANMSHEIRTPMNAILGLSHLVRRELPPGPNEERLARLRESAQHLLTLVNGILDLSKIESGKLALEDIPFELDKVIGSARGMVAEAARDKGLGFTTDSVALPHSLRGDPTRLLQALVNLLSNAVKFTESGSVRLETSVVDDGMLGPRLRFEVTDTGPGIAAAVLPRLFNAFEQGDSSTTRRFGGAGLGLAITRHLAESMGGEAGVCSRLGVGSKFWITVALRRGPSISAPDASGTIIEAGEAAVEQASVATEQSLRDKYEGTHILLAEDNPVNQEVARSLLRAAGLRVDLACNGQHAVTLAATGDHALILMDMQMPEMDGLEATRCVRATQRGRSIPIIAMTANAFEEDRRACFDAGMDDFLSKPVEPHDLYAVLERWLAKKATREGHAPA